MDFWSSVIYSNTMMADISYNSVEASVYNCLKAKYENSGIYGHFSTAC